MAPSGDLLPSKINCDRKKTIPAGSERIHHRRVSDRPRPRVRGRRRVVGHGQHRHTGRHHRPATQRRLVHRQRGHRDGAEPVLHRCRSRPRLRPHPGHRHGHQRRGAQPPLRQPGPRSTGGLGRLRRRRRRRRRRNDEPALPVQPPPLAHPPGGHHLHHLGLRHPGRTDLGGPLPAPHRDRHVGQDSGRRGQPSRPRFGSPPSCSTPSSLPIHCSPVWPRPTPGRSPSSTAPPAAVCRRPACGCPTPRGRSTPASCAGPPVSPGPPAPSPTCVPGRCPDAR